MAATPVTPAPILLVDDRPANLLALETILSDLTLDLVRAASGDETLRQTAARDFAVILLDVQMPGLNGFETAQRVRAAARSRHTPIIFLSAAETDEFPVVEAYRLGAVDYLVKPIIPEILRAKVVVFVELFQASERLRAFERRERERAEEAARETAQRFDQFMKHLPGLAWIKDADGRYLYANAAAERAFGAAGGSLHGRTDDDLFPAATAATFRANDRRAAESANGVLEIETLTHPDGTVHHSLVSKFPIPRRDGSPLIGGVAINVTARMRAEAALQQSETRYRALVGATSHAVWSWSLDGANADFSQTQQWWEDLTGQTVAEQAANLAGNWLAVVHPDDRTRAAAAWETSLASGEAYDIEYRVRARAGGWRHVRARGVPIRTPEGAIREWIGTLDDVTDQTEAEAGRRFLADAAETLASSLDYEATLAAVAGLVVPRMADWCGVYVTEPAGGFRQIAVAHADPAKVAWARELANRYPPAPDDPRGVPAVIRTGRPEFAPDLTDEMVARSARDAGHAAILRGLGLRSVMIVPLAARDRILGAITFVAAESGRRYTPADLDLAVDLGRRAGLAVDNARLFHESQESLRLLGLLAEASSRLTGSLDPPAVRAAILDLSHRLVEADAYAIWRHDNGEWTIADSEGLSTAYLATGNIANSSHAMPGHPIVAEDVLATTRLESRRRAYEAEGIVSLMALPLNAQNPLAGTLVFYYRTRRPFDDGVIRVATALASLSGAALATADLYARESDSRQRAEQADRRKDEFIAVLAHELRNPLAPIRNALEILRRRGGDVAIANRAREMIERQTIHLSRLVDDLLDVSRITTGKVRLRVERLDLAHVARQALADRHSEFDAKGIALAGHAPPTAVWVNGDRTRLAQILDNLLTNALKFTPRGGTVELTLTAEDGTARLAVRDTGAGLDPELVPRLFETFSQADRTLDRSGGGLGLGLAIVKGLATLHGGGARADSAGLGHGSTFTVTLPTQTGPATERVVANDPVQPARRLRALVIEDNRDAADSLAMLLETYGCQVKVAYTGPDGVRAAEAYRPEAILCDIGLPGMDGYAVAAAVRANPLTAAVRMIALTGYGQDEDRRRAKEAGFDDHLTKPADPAILEAMLNAP